MGLLREDGTPKPALEHFDQLTPQLGLCQWFHFEDHRLDDAVAWMKRLGVTHLRTGLSWADSFRPNALAWFDRQMEALADFDVTVTFCFTPEHRGIAPHHTSAPLDEGGVRRFLRRDDPPLRAGGDNERPFASRFLSRCNPGNGNVVCGAGADHGRRARGIDRS